MKLIKNCLRFILAGVLFVAVINVKALDYYWVGGSGNWSQYATHWATSSGGSAFQAQVPQSTDNVFFDANSFIGSGQAVTIDQTIVNCNSMDWSGANFNPTLGGASTNTLKIYGSLTLIQAMSYHFSGPVYFQSTTTGQTVTSASQVFGAQVIFEGIGGGWTLMDSLCIYEPIYQASGITLDNGSLFTNNQQIRCTGFGSFGSGNRVLNLGSSTIYTGFSIQGPNLAFNAGTSMIYCGGFSGGNFTFHNVHLYPNAVILANDTFNNVYMEGGIATFMQANITFNNLTLAPGQNYFIGYNDVVTIDSGLTLAGSCAALTFLECYGTGHATLRKTTGTVNADFVALQNIRTAGGATFTATSCVDLGGNTGWAMTSLTGKNLYWVGGSGNWSDGTHWSVTSGGAGTGCIPSPLDNVYFDANSFNAAGQIVNVDITYAYCNNMDWTGATNNPIFQEISPNNYLELYGSITFIAGMTNSFAGNVYCQATSPGKTITSATQPFRGNINFSGVGGGWTLQDSLTVLGGVQMAFGTLNTGNNSIYSAGGFYFEGDGTSTTAFNMGSSHIYIGTGGVVPVSSWEVVNYAFVLNAGTSVIVFNDNANFYGGNLTYHDIYFNYGASYNFNASSTYNNVYIDGDAYILGNNTFNNLTLYAGYAYQLNAGGTQTILDSLYATGTCSGAIYIESTTQGTQAAIKKVSGAITVNFAFLQDIKATGGAMFTANNSTDGGDNTGWTINASTSKNLYWVDGAGNWSDGTHWSLTSGGPGLGCIPTPVDNVYFDVNSFTGSGRTVTLDIASAYCRDMDWTGASNGPLFLGNYANVLYVYGSLTLINAMNFAFTGYLYFSADTTGKTITSHGQNIPAQVIFNGAGGEWTLQDPFINSSFIYFNYGTFNSNNYNIYANQVTGSAFVGPFTLNLGSSTVTVSGGTWTMYQFITLNSGTSLIQLTGGADFVGGGLVYHDVEIYGYGTMYENNTFHNLTIGGTLDIKGSNSCSSLFFNNPGSTVTLTAGTTQTISDTGQLTATGTAGFPIRIQSSIADSQFIFLKTAGTVCLNYVRLSDSKATGGAIFNAGASSQDLGDNTGWSFSGGGGGNPGVSISSSQSDTICTGSGITFTATPTNGGIPTFDWLVNGISRQNGASAIYTSSDVTNNENVRCIMISGGSCSTVDTVLSNAVPVTVSSTVTASISIAALQTVICSGTPVSFTATAMNGGASPSYQWIKNSNHVGTNANTYIDSTLSNNDTISCRMVSNAGCVTDTSAISNLITVTVNPKALPGSISAVPDTVCAGTPAILRVTGSSTGVQWQSSLSGNNFTNIAGADTAFYSVQPSQTTYYRVFAGSGTCTDTAATFKLLVNPLPNPPTLSTSDSNICSYDSARIISSGAYTSYQWNNGDTRSYTYEDSTGEYWVTVTDANGCKAVSSPQSIAVLPAPAEPALSTNDSAICSADSTKITATGGYTSYLWSNGDTSGTIYVSNAGDYWVTATGANGCIAVSVHQQISVYPVPSVSILRNGDTLSSYGAVSYQWILNEHPISNATGPVFVATEQGSYAVEITDSNGCVATSSPVVITGISPLSFGEEPGVRIYPNPSVAGWQLMVDEDLLGSKLEVFDDEGRLVFKSEISNLKSKIGLDVPTGIYYLRISSPNLSVVKKLVKL